MSIIFNRYSSVTKKYLLCLHENTEIINYPGEEEELLRTSYQN